MISSKTPLVGDLMTPGALTIKSDRTLDEAEAFLTEHRIIAAPVVTPGGNPIGVMTDFQLLKCYLKRTQQGPSLLFVGNYLTDMEPLHTVEVSEPITEAFKIMLQAPSRRIFVTKDGQLCGSLQPSDLYEFMAEREKIILNKPKVKQALPIAESIFMNSACLVYATDMGGTIVASNPLINLMLGYVREELNGKNIRELYPVTAHEDAFEGFTKIQQVGYQPSTNISLVKKNSELVKADVTSFLRYDENGLPIGVVTVGRPTVETEFVAALRLAAKDLKPKVG